MVKGKARVKTRAYFMLRKPEQFPVIRDAKKFNNSAARWLCAKVDQKRVCTIKKHYYLYPDKHLIYGHKTKTG